MMYGIQNEDNALEVFMSTFKMSHINAKITKMGLPLFEDKPYIGGSPDGVVSCECCEASILLEVKCPFRLAMTGISSWEIF